MTDKNIGGRLILAALLIGFGVTLLLTNLGILSGGLWNNLIKLWPALFVVLGVSSMVQQREILGPVISITIGLSLLLGNYNLLSPLAWGILISLWPLLLIAGGLEVINHRRSILAAIASTAVLVALTLGIYWYSGAFTASPGMVQPVENITIPLGEIQSAEIEISPGVGTLEIDGAAETGVLVSGAVPESGGEPEGEVSYRESSGTGVFLFTQTEDHAAFPWTGGQQFYSFLLTGEVPLDLKANLGVGFQLLNLTRLAVDSIDLNSGITIAEIVLSRDPGLRGELDAGIGQTTVIVPAGLPLRVRLETGLVITTAPEDYTRAEGMITSPGFDEDEPFVDLTINQAIGLVRIEEAEER